MATSTVMKGNFAGAVDASGNCYMPYSRWPDAVRLEFVAAQVNISTRRASPAKSVAYSITDGTATVSGTITSMTLSTRTDDEPHTGAKAGVFDSETLDLSGLNDGWRTLNITYTDDNDDTRTEAVSFWLGPVADVYCNINAVTNGDGSSGSPYNNLDDALDHVELEFARPDADTTHQASRIICTTSATKYVYERTGSHQDQNSAPIQITSASGDRADVIIQPNNDEIRLRAVEFVSVTIDHDDGGTSLLRFRGRGGGFGEAYIFRDVLEYRGGTGRAGQTTVQSPTFNFLAGEDFLYYVDSTIEEINGKVFGSAVDIIRNCHIENIGEDVWQNTTFVMNSFAINNNNPTSGHPDVLQFLGDTIIYNCKAHDCEGQYIFSSEEIDGPVFIINFEGIHRTGVNNISQIGNNDSNPLQVNQPVALINCTLPNQALRIIHNDGVNPGTRHTCTIVHNCVFEDVAESGTAEASSVIDIRNGHSTDPDSTDDSDWTNWTVGDASFVDGVGHDEAYDADAVDLTPDTGSALLDRSDIQAWPFDIYGREVPNDGTGAIGAVQPERQPMEYTGALYCGPRADSSRVYTWDPLIDTASFTLIYVGIRTDLLQIQPTDDPASDTAAIMRYYTGSWGGGGGGNDGYLRYYPPNHSNASRQGAIEFRISKNGQRPFTNSNIRSAGDIMQAGITYTIAFVHDAVAETCTLYLCEEGGSATSIATGTYNSNWGNRDPGTVAELGFGWNGAIQAVGVVGRPLTTGEIEDIADGVDPETAVLLADRTQWHNFSAPDATITPDWGSGNATRVGDWSKQPTRSPILPNATQRIECAEPPALKMYGLARGSSTRDIPINGSFTGGAIGTIQYRLLNAFALDEAVAWTSLTSFNATVASSGSWSGTMAAVPSGSYVLQLRDGSNTSNTWLGGNPWCVGPVALTIGQSPMAIMESQPAAVGNGTAFSLVISADGGEPYMATVADDAGGYEALAYQFQDQGGDVVGLIAAAAGGTSSEDWSDDPSSQWTNALALLDAFDPSGFVHVMWLNGSSDLSFVGSGDIATNHDTIYANIGDDIITARSLEACYVMIPHQRQTSGSETGNWNVRDEQRTWALDAADYGSGIYLGPSLADVRMNSEHEGTVRAVTATTTQLAADYDGNSSEEPEFIIVGGETLTVLSYNASTKTATHATRSGSVTADVSPYVAYGASPHQANENGDDGSRRMGARIGQHLAVAHGLTATSDQGPTITAATIPYGGDGSEIDVTVTHVSGSALRTIANGVNADDVYGFEVSVDAGSNWSAVTGEIIDATTVRLTGHSAPSDTANLRVRYLYGHPIQEADFRELPNLLYDNSGISFESGAPVWTTFSDLTPEYGDFVATTKSNVIVRLRNNNRRYRTT